MDSVNQVSHLCISGIIGPLSPANKLIKNWQSKQKLSLPHSSDTQQLNSDTNTENSLGTHVYKNYAHIHRRVVHGDIFITLWVNFFYQNFIDWENKPSQIITQLKGKV